MAHRILVGTHEIANNIAEYGEAFRQLGHQVTTVVFQENRFYPDSRYDLVTTRAALGDAGMAKLIAEHDVFVFVWESLFPGHADLPLLRQLGKKIVMLLCGDDVRHYSAYQEEYGVNLAALAPDRYAGDPLQRPLRTLRLAERYADVLLSQPNQAGLAVRPYHFSVAPLDITKITPTIPGREVPVVVHAPSHSGAKGSAHILAALDRLRARGVAFELRLLRDVPNREVFDALRDADVAIDQLYAPTLGRFGIEALACGCALATARVSPHRELPEDPPAWHIDEQQLDEPLARLLTDREARLSLARAARPFVAKYANLRLRARRILELVTQRTRGPFDYYPRHYLERFRIPDDHAVPHELATMTAHIVQRWGVPAELDLSQAAARGVIIEDPFAAFDTVPRWEPGTGISTPWGTGWDRRPG